MKCVALIEVNAKYLKDEGLVGDGFTISDYLDFQFGYLIPKGIELIAVRKVTQEEQIKLELK